MVLQRIVQPLTRNTYTHTQHAHAHTDGIAFRQGKPCHTGTRSPLSPRGAAHTSRTRTARVHARTHSNTHDRWALLATRQNGNAGVSLVYHAHRVQPVAHNVHAGVQVHGAVHGQPREVQQRHGRRSHVGVLDQALQWAAKVAKVGCVGERMGVRGVGEGDALRGHSRPPKTGTGKTTTQLPSAGGHTQPSVRWQRSPCTPH
jgi:hypothetical protein